MHNIKNDIKNKIFSNVYIMCGEEEYLTDYYKKQIVSSTVDEDTKEFNLMEIYSSFPDVTDIDAFVNSYPFMSEKKVLVVEDTGIFKRSTEEQKSFFGDLISSMPDYLIILFCEKDIDKRNSLYKQISKIYPVCEQEFQSVAALTQWITKIFTSAGKAIDREDASYVCEIAGPSMLSLKSEAEKLIAFSKDKIERSTIDALVTRNIENRVFAMIDDIAASNREEATKKLSDLRALNEEPIRIINIIFNKFATFHKLLVLKDRPMREICTLCNLYEKHARNNLAQAQKLGGRKIASVMVKCRDMDFAVKSGNMEKWLAVELIIAEALS